MRRACREDEEFEWFQVTFNYITFVVILMFSGVLYSYKETVLIPPETKWRYVTVEKRMFIVCERGNVFLASRSRCKFRTQAPVLRQHLCPIHGHVIYNHGCR